MKRVSLRYVLCSCSFVAFLGSGCGDMPTGLEDGGSTDAGTDTEITDAVVAEDTAPDGAGAHDAGPSSPHASCRDTAADIVATPATESELLAVGLTRMLTLPLNDGGEVRFFAQDQVSDVQLLRARRVFRFYLANVPGSAFGTDKSAIASALAASRASLVYFNTEADSEAAQESLPPGNIVWQDLYATESPVEGSRDYLQSTVRDATFEELFHLLQGGGIQPALGAYQTQIEEATAAALANSVWTPPADVLAEWRAEGSESFEYIISVVDVFYGLWEHAPPPSFYGEYQVAARGSLAEQDPLGLAAVRAFLPDYAGHWVEIDASFNGTFTMSFDAELPYTLKSQHLRDATLSGDMDSSLTGNALNNTLRGNLGANTLDGRAGEDTAVYCQPRSAYEIRDDGNVTLVAGPDGNDSLVNIEHIQFADEVLDL